MYKSSSVGPIDDRQNLGMREKNKNVWMFNDLNGERKSSCKSAWNFFCGLKKKNCALILSTNIVAETDGLELPSECACTSEHKTTSMVNRIPDEHEKGIGDHFSRLFHRLLRFSVACLLWTYLTRISNDPTIKSIIRFGCCCCCRWWCVWKVVQ